MNDILPDAAVAWDHVEATLVDCLRRYGYRPIRMPLVERTELFVRSIGEATDIVEKETYTFTDRNGDSLTLRPEGTASCVRAVLEHNLLYAGPQRLYYTGAMFRHERPQKGRYRQFHQVGVEALGFEGPDVDAELIVMCARMWRELGLSDVALELNTLGDPQARARYRTRLVAYLEEHHGELDDDSRRRLHTNPLRVLDSKNPALQALIANAPRMLDDLDEPSLLHFERLQALLRAAGVPFTLNPRLVRGLDYYNRTVFEWVTSRLGAQAAVCAGGRYDGLVQELGGKPAPACGFALGVERLIELLQVEGVQLPVAVPDIYVVHQGEAAAQWAWSTCERLRSRGLAVVLHCGGGNFKAQLRKADASGARYAIVIGDDEAQARKVSLKPLRQAGAQMLVDIDQVPDLVQAALGGNAAAGRAPEPGE